MVAGCGRTTPRFKTSGRDADAWKRVAAALFSTFRDYQHQPGITDDQLIAAGKGSSDTKARIELWSRQPRPF